MKNFFWFGLLLFCVQNLCAQESSYREKLIHVDSTEEIHIDTLTIYPNSFTAFCGNQKLTWKDYLLDLTNGTIRFFHPCSHEIRLKYRVFPIDFAKTVNRRDTSLIFTTRKGDQTPYLTEVKSNDYDLFGTASLNKSGSISRGISFGNNQDMAVNSTMNLELSGNLTPNLKILGSLSDANIPIQADGNTNKLQEFDKIFIQLYNNDFKLIGGDFWLTKPYGYFMNYNKRGQGLSGEYYLKLRDSSKITFQGSGAFSKGKFNRQNIQGVEGNQGPYRLVGANNESNIIVLSGTEKVYIDGVLLKRGQEFDYVIDYNMAEVTFTSRDLITKDKRIYVEFQYSDQNYARSLIQFSSHYEGKKFDAWINAYSEQDAKNRSIQQSLSVEQKQYLASIGDHLSDAYISSIDSVGFMENQNMYRLVDSLGYDSVLVYSVDKQTAKYSAVFTYVGSNQGDYILKNYNALGKVYKWVQPIGGVPQGDYQAKRVITTPQKRQMVSVGGSYHLNDKLKISNEFAYTNHDVNTFSKLDADDNEGWSNKTQLMGNFKLSKDSIPKWKLLTTADVELLQRNFQYIENYRSVEYDRDWNTRGRGYKGNEVNSNIQADFRHLKYGHFLINGAQYSIGNEYAGYKGAIAGNWDQKGFHATFDASYLSSKADDYSSKFLRHKIDVSQTIKFIRIGVSDEYELNKMRDSLGNLSGDSHQFIDYQAYLENADTSKNTFRVFYRERYDQLSNLTTLKKVTTARNIGTEFSLNSVKNQRLSLVFNYRQLKINDSVLTTQTPENTLLGRLEYKFDLFKRAISWNTYYEVGSGLELKQQFQYLKVADGQGVYTWIDYNNDGVKDLNEFEIAQYSDEASYIRVYVRGTEYTPVYTNQFNQTISLRPEQIWRNKKGIKKVLSRFSDQARFRIDRKTNTLDKTSFNPFAMRINDTVLVSTSSTIHNSFYFNRTDPIFGAEYAYSDIRSKTLLASGFDAQTNTYHELDFHLNIKRKFTLEGDFQVGKKSANADYTVGRNYDYKFYLLKPSLSFQPSTAFRLTFENRLTKKDNIDTLQAFIQEYTFKLKWNQSQKGSLQTQLSYLKIKYNGEPNSAIGYEMLESLKPGNNFTWSISYQYSISKNLQLSVQYSGRKSEGTKMIHTGGMEVRAFF